MIAALVLATAGMLAIAISMPRHRAQLGWRPASAKQATALRAAGTLLLIVAAAAAVSHLGLGVGIFAWIMSLSVGAILVIALLSWREAPRKPKR